MWKGNSPSPTPGWKLDRSARTSGTKTIRRKKYLEEMVKSYISAGADVELVNQPDWKSSSSELTAEFKVKIPGWIPRPESEFCCRWVFSPQ